MTTELLTERSVVTLRDRAIAAAKASYDEWQIEKAQKAREEREREIEVLRIALRDKLGVTEGVTVAEHTTDHRGYEIVEYRATVDGLVFSLRKDEFGNASWPRLHVLMPCARECGKDLWVISDELESLGSALDSTHEHRFACLQQFDDEGEPTTDTDGKLLPPRGPFSDPPKSSSPWQRAKDRVASIPDAGARCGEAHARVMELEDQRALIKPEAIKRIMEQGLASSNSAAERLVEQDPFYAEHRVKQRDAETERWAALAAYEAAKLTARLAVESFVVEERNR